jgi:flagellin
MDFSLLTNLNAMVATYYLGQTNQAIAQSVQRLSTGLQINSPSDNPSGFVIANSLQSQIDGMNQSISNIQDSNNMMKTTASAVTQVSTLVNDIKTSALDAQANPSNAGIDQTSIQQALQSLNNIAGSTYYGSKNLLNGSAGTTANVTNSSDISGISFGGTFGNGITQNGPVTVTVTQAATAATVTGSVSYASTSATFATSGSITINGQTVNVNAGDSVQTMMNNINSVANVSGVTAGFTSGHVVLTQENYGSNFSVNESETGSFITSGGASVANGTNAVASVTAMTEINNNTQPVTTTFTGGQSPGTSGLLLTDSYGNSVTLTPAGNTTSTSNVQVGEVSSNAATFQIGPNSGQTASFSFQNMTAGNLGTGVISGQNLDTIDVTTPTGAANAVQIATAAAQQVTTYAASIGNFQNNVLTATQNYLSSSVTNLTASVSQIMDVNVAQESTNLANLSQLQQSGVAALYTANNSMNSLVSKLLP